MEFGYNVFVFLISMTIILAGMLVLCGIEKLFINTDEEDEEEDDEDLYLEI